MLYLQALLGIISIQAIFGRIAIRFRTDKVTDLAYGGAFLLVVWWVYLTASDQSLLHTCLVRLISFRSVRLAGYLFLRVIVLGKDKRFDGIREVRRSFIRFRILQAVCIFLVLLPTLFAMQTSQPSMARYGRIGVLVALGGFSLETIADRQKFRFKQQYPTRRCDSGVWSIIRYPNYLGEMFFRIGIYMICLSVLSRWQVIIGAISPFTIVRLLLFITGIPPLEREHELMRGKDPERQAYKKHTSRLIPYIY